MIKSRFRLWVLLPVVLVVFISWYFCIIVREAILDDSPPVRLVYGILLVMMAGSWIWAVFGELRTKVLVVTLEGDFILCRNFIGIGPTQKRALREFDGFSTSTLTSNYQEYEFLYLMKDNKKAIKLSEFYHGNYAEMKQSIADRMNFLGHRPYSTTQELKEVFQ